MCPDINAVSREHCYGSKVQIPGIIYTLNYYPAGTVYESFQDFVVMIKTTGKNDFHCLCLESIYHD